MPSRISKAILKLMKQGKIMVQVKHNLMLRMVQLLVKLPVTLELISMRQIRLQAELKVKERMTAIEACLIEITTKTMSKMINLIMRATNQIKLMMAQ
jgi:hypothetical protein